MSAGQIAIVLGLLALGLFGIPGYALGWWNGRRLLRAALDPRRLPRVASLEVRVIHDEPLTTLPRSGRLALSITCPRCGLTSWNADDIAQGYCGGCHDWTSPRVVPEDPFPTTPMRLGSEHRAQLDRDDRDHAAQLAANEREIRDMIDAADQRDPYRRRRH